MRGRVLIFSTQILSQAFRARLEISPVKPFVVHPNKVTTLSPRLLMKAGIARGATKKTNIWIFLQIFVRLKTFGLKSPQQKMSLVVLTSSMLSTLGNSCSVR